MKYLTFLMIIIFFTIPLYSYEFIQSYFPDSNAVALSAVENGRGGYVVLIGVKWGSWWDNIGYGIMEVDSMGNYERYVRIFHGGSK